MSSKQKNQYHHGNLRAELITAAWQHIKQDGTETLSLRALSRSLGVSQAAPYRHFTSKTELLNALAIDAFHSLQQVTEQAHQQHPHSARNALHAAGLAYITFATDNPHRYRMMFEAAAQPQPHDSELKQAGGDSYNALRQIINQGIQQQQFADQPLETLTLAAWSTAHGLAGLINDGLVPPALTGDIAELALQITQIAIQGVARAESLPD